jgi:hypothetical protein
MKAIVFHAAAEIEMVEAAKYYENQQSDLGKRFLTSVQETLNRIQINPFLFPVVATDIRRGLTKTFPYGVLFQIRGEHIIIMAVMHLHRNPGYWKARIS